MCRQDEFQKTSEKKRTCLKYQLSQQVKKIQTVLPPKLGTATTKAVKLSFTVFGVFSCRTTSTVDGTVILCSPKRCPKTDKTEEPFSQRQTVRSLTERNEGFSALIETYLTIKIN